MALGRWQLAFGRQGELNRPSAKRQRLLLCDPSCPLWLILLPQVFQVVAQALKAAGQVHQVEDQHDPGDGVGGVEKFHRVLLTARPSGSEMAAMAWASSTVWRSRSRR